MVKCYPECVQQPSGGETELGSSTSQHHPNKSAQDYKITQTTLI